MEKRKRELAGRGNKEEMRDDQIRRRRRKRENTEEVRRIVGQLRCLLHFKKKKGME